MHNQVVDNEGWEARMAQRAAARRAVREAEQHVEHANLDAERDRLIERLLADRTWLHGWPVKEGGAVWIGNGSHCLGCGLLTGVFTVVIDGPMPQRPDPDWPFAQADCELCDIQRRRGYRWWLTAEPGASG